MYCVIQFYSFSFIDGSHVEQLCPFLPMNCLAKIKLVTLSTLKEFVFLVLMQLTCENILSAQAEECGKTVSEDMNSDNISNLLLLSPSLIDFKQFQYFGMLSEALCCAMSAAESL